MLNTEHIKLHDYHKTVFAFTIDLKSCIEISRAIFEISRNYLEILRR